MWLFSLVFCVFSDIVGFILEFVEGIWNFGIGFFVVVVVDKKDVVIVVLNVEGMFLW